MIKTEDLSLLGEGTQKLVYQHPLEANKVIKIMKPENVTMDGGRAGQHRLRAHRSQGVYRQFRREMLQYLQLCKNNYQHKQFLFPIETVYGFIATDLGLGLVTEKIVALNGQGQSVFDLCQQQAFNQKHRQALDRFFSDCCQLHVVFGEVNVAGVMYTEDRQDRPEFVLVDGIGEKLLIPFRAMSKHINTRNIRKVEEKINAFIDKHVNEISR